MSYVTCADHITRLFVRDWGEGDPIVFLAGWTLSSDAWAYQMTPLSQRFRCVAFDRRGHGRSDDPGRGHDYDTLAGDIASVIDTLDLKNVTLVAHSFASGEAVRYLTRYGTQRVKRLLLLAPAAVPYLRQTADNPMGLPDAAIDEVVDTIARDFPSWIEANAEPYFRPAASRAVIDWTVRDMTKASMLATVTLTRLQMTTDFRPELQRLDVPTLIIHGDADASAPIELTGRPAAALIPQAELRVYEGAGHGLYFTHQQRLNEDIACFHLAAGSRL
jgi:pimeloyl-ACP methyl ester carboxylesterase